MAKVSGIILSVLFMLVLSCQEEGPDVPGEVEFFLLDEYECYEESAEIDTTSIVFSDEALLQYADLKSYNARECYFKVTDEARERLENMEHSVNGIAFAVRANQELIYTGYFVPAYSSASVQWIVIDPVFWHSTNRMFVKLGYPGQFEDSVIPDLRNDKRILQIFRRDKNLTE